MHNGTRAQAQAQPVQVGTVAPERPRSRSAGAGCTGRTDFARMRRAPDTETMLAHGVVVHSGVAKAWKAVHATAPLGGSEATST